MTPDALARFNQLKAQDPATLSALEQAELTDLQNQYNYSASQGTLPVDPATQTQWTEGEVVPPGSTPDMSAPDQPPVTDPTPPASEEVATPDPVVAEQTPPQEALVQAEPETNTPPAEASQEVPAQPEQSNEVAQDQSTPEQPQSPAVHPLQGQIGWVDQLVMDLESFLAETPSFLSEAADAAKHSLMAAKVLLKRALKDNGVE